MNNKMDLSEKLPRRKPIRLKGHNYSESYVYSLTFCTHKKMSLLIIDKQLNMLKDILINKAGRFDIDLHAFCIMPNHVHVLAQPVGGHSISKYVNAVKRELTMEMHRNGTQQVVWQRGFYDHILRDAEDIGKVVIYILENPERKGLVRHFFDFQWSWDKYGIKEMYKQGEQW